jgi:hypothetical protein
LSRIARRAATVSFVCYAAFDELTGLFPILAIALGTEQKLRVIVPRNENTGVVMVMRALFWIALVAVLMPREPDLGLGRPGTQGFMSDAMSWVSAAKPAKMCEGREAACAAGFTFLDSLQSVTVRSLAQVKADIEEQQRERAMRPRD